MAKKKRIQKHEEENFNRSLFPNDCENWEDKAPVNQANWSLSSQNSYSCPSVYQSYNYRCRVCKTKCLFTAKEQKHAYEVEKRYIGQVRVLCKTCFADMHSKRETIKTINARWQNEKNKLQNDVAFLQDWLTKLEDFQRYDQKSNSTIFSLKRRIEKMESQNEKLRSNQN